LQQSHPLNRTMPRVSIETRAHFTTCCWPHVRANVILNGAVHLLVKYDPWLQTQPRSRQHWLVAAKQVDDIFKNEWTNTPFRKYLRLCCLQLHGTTISDLIKTRLFLSFQDTCHFIREFCTRTCPWRGV